VTEVPEPAAAEQSLWRDLQPLLDEELSRLPDRYRSVIVVCDLEGKTRKEAARQLGCPEGTVGGRLARARVMLAKRLTGRGVALSGGALAAVLSQRAASAGVPTSVVSATIKAASSLAAGQAAAGVISVKVAVLTEGVLKAMFVTKLKTAMAVLLMVALVGIGGGATALLAGDEDGQVTTGVAVAPREESPRKKAKSDQPDIHFKETNEAEDDKFIRRTYLDLLGVLPTPDQIKQFQQDKALGKRKRLVARLIVRVTMEDALKKLPDDETRRLALEEIEKFVKALKEKNEAEDGKFIRRAYLDLLGVLPTPDDIKQFQQDKAPGKRKRLVARLHVTVTMEDALKKVPDAQTRRLALEEIEKFVKALTEMQPESKDKPQKK
jgi:hypothetical protein